MSGTNNASDEEGDQSGRGSSFASWTTNEEDSDLEFESTTVVRVVMKPNKELMKCYFLAIKEIKRQIDPLEASVDSEYIFERVLIASNVATDVLETLPNLVGEYYIKSVVEDGQLFITSVATGPHHAAGVNSIVKQANAWNVEYGPFDVESDANSSFEGNSSAPDLVIVVNRKFTHGVGRRPRVAIVELEVSNRSVVNMRKDFLIYFREPSVRSVIGIKVFGGVACPGARAIAVHWTRTPQGIAVAAVRDFGLLPISGRTKNLMATPGADVLAAVDRELWTHNRFEPVPEQHIVPAGSAQAARTWVRALPDGSQLYNQGTALPTITILGADLVTQLNVEVEIQNFVLDLGNMLYKIADV